MYLFISLVFSSSTNKRKPLFLFHNIVQRRIRASIANRRNNTINDAHAQ